MSMMKSPSTLLLQSRISANSMEETFPQRPSTVSFSPDGIHSSSTCTLNQPAGKERLKATSSIGLSRLNQQIPTTLHPSYHSQRSLIDDNNKEQIWIKRRLSNSASEKLFDRRKPFLWKEIIDVTV